MLLNPSESGNVLSCNTAQHVPTDELMTKGVQSALCDCDKSINKCLNNNNFNLPGGEDPFQWDINKDETDAVGDNRLGMPSHKPEGDMNPTINCNNARHDTLLEAELALPDQTSGGLI